MRFKLTPELCYLAGLTGRSREPERSQVGIATGNDDIAERFIKYSIAQGVDTRKILIEEKETLKHIYYYHSKLSRMIREIMNDRVELARKSPELAIAFLAGTFDANGHVFGGRVSMRRLDRSDELLLERLNVHTVNGSILNITRFMHLIGKSSIILAGAG